MEPAGTEYPEADAIVLDISHNGLLKKKALLPHYFRQLRQKYSTLAMFDGLGSLFLSQLVNVKIDLVVIPYVNAHLINSILPSDHIATGPDFFILDHAYNNSRSTSRHINKRGNKLLITAGGSDPTGLTLKTLQSLSHISGNYLDVRVVIGPAFASDVESAIHREALEGRHLIMLIEKPETLFSNMVWCDLAVSASGLTKYELAATGTPAILLSINGEDALLTKPFEDSGAAIHLGVGSTVSNNVLADKITSLLGKPDDRERMSKAGFSMVDCKGTERVADMILDTRCDH